MARRDGARPAVARRLLLLATVTAAASSEEIPAVPYLGGWVGGFRDRSGKRWKTRWAWGGSAWTMSLVCLRVCVSHRWPALGWRRLLWKRACAHMRAARTACAWTTHRYDFQARDDFGDDTGASGRANPCVVGAGKTRLATGEDSSGVSRT